MVLLAFFLSTESFRCLGTFVDLVAFVGVTTVFVVCLMAFRFLSGSELDSLESESLLVESSDDAELLDLDSLLRKGLSFTLSTSESSESLDEDDEPLLDEPLLELELDDDELESFGPKESRRKNICKILFLVFEFSIGENVKQKKKNKEK